MSLSAVPLNVYPYGGNAVVNNPGTGLTSYALSANTNAGTLNAFPTVGSGGTAGVWTAGSTFYCAGFLDGSQRSRLFYTDGNSVALPTIKSIAQVQYTDSVSLKGGLFRVMFTPSANNLIDATSPMTFYMDGFAILILASTQYG
jgi:hypothetical protein